MPPILELRGVTKAFPGVLANDHIDLALNEGEILALLGENGAGKTTLMNILYGLYTPDEGEIFIRGQQVDVHDPNDAIEQGIGMVHQHFMLVPVFTVTENVMLGVESTRAGVLLDREAAAARIREISSRFGLEVDPNAMVEDLPVGVQQRVEIIKVLYREADILILDEPTAVLTPQEVDELFTVVRSLVDQGKSVIFITHKLKEVLSIADRISVLRAGRVVGSAIPQETTEAALANMMVGREVILQVEKRPAAPQEPVLEVEGLRVTDDRGATAVDGVSLEVRAGEVLGIAGVQGNGQTELVQALTGLRPVEAGQASILGEKIIVPAEQERSRTPWLRAAILITALVAAMLVSVLTPSFFLILVVGYLVAGLVALIVTVARDPRGFFHRLFRPTLPRRVIERGVAHVPEDRQQDGLILSFPVEDNMVMNTYYVPPFARGITLQREEIEEAAQERTKLFDVRTPGIAVPVSNLSGGNQQKVIVAREFSRPIKLLIASQPTRGLDVGSIEYIHGRIVEKRDEGCGVLLVSPELDEILGLSDRIAVMYRGQILATVPAAKATKERLGLLMAGVTQQAPAQAAA